MAKLKRLKELPAIVRASGVTAFCETGTAQGTGIDWAMGMGLSPVWSCDTAWASVSRARKAYPNAVILHEPSTKALQRFLREIPDRTMFWLDAHSRTLDPFPLLEELAVIRATRPATNDLIVIDDIDVLPGGPRGPRHRQTVAGPSHAELLAALPPTFAVQTIIDHTSHVPVLVACRAT